MKAKTLGTAILCSAILLGTSLLGQSTDNDVAALKAQLAEQQKQIDALKSAMEEEKKLFEKATSAVTPVKPGQDTFALPRNKALGDVASTTPIIPSIAPSPFMQSAKAPTPGSTMRSAERAISGSAVTRISCPVPCSPATRANAFSAERRLPEP